ncbi:RES family NAD+ phosphorylase [Azospirillum sp. SYSU D00513]|uniref:RES family NAD+ phosphorylase n=1 Tax=Azospirillum sp. SYSU D00513 TaxID=2812561 RepID=UPI001A95F9FA|nr:RES family NAD+ phosphorylase [Azospirillum sp. SYSU D00513]
MKLWRISNPADLRGIGGLRAGARWHNRGRPIVYLAESAPGASLEILVHQEISSPADLPDGYRLLTVEVDDGVLPANCPDLPEDWREREALTRAIGDQWLAEGASALLRVPSAIMPDVHNILLNPLHPDAAKARIVSSRLAPFDRRLFHVVKG